MGDDIGDLFRGGSTTWFTILAGIYILWSVLGKVFDVPFWKKKKRK
jgi:hypothetical protein